MGRQLAPSSQEPTPRRLNSYGDYILECFASPWGDKSDLRGERSPQPFLTRPVSWRDFVDEVLFLQEYGDGTWYTFAEGK
jgi:hypothetical protein